MPWGFAAVATATIGSSLIGANAAQSAANTQANAATQAAQLQKQELQPWLDAGQVGLNQLQAGIKPGGQFNTPFTMAQAQNMPAYQFALSQGEDAINKSAAARGGLLGTNDIQNTTTFAEGTAAQYENQAFNQWLQQNAQALGATESLAQTGQTVAQNVADTGANAVLAAGGAQAAGQIGQANAIGGGISSLSNQLTTLSQLFGGGTGTLSTPSMAGIGYATPYDTSGDVGAFNPTLSPINLSDRRLKTDIKRVGKTHDGTPIYTYRMKGSNKLEMGVMAQDVEDVNPKAVHTGAHGYKMVDYRKVH